MTGSAADAQLVEKAALRHLSDEYAAAVDGRDGERFAALFLEDGELVVPDLPRELAPVVTRRGRGQLRRIPEGLRRYRSTFHEVSTASFELAADVATGRVWCVAHHLSEPAGSGGTGGVDLVWLIRYADDYRRTAEGWRFARRVLHLLAVEERPLRLLGPGTDR